MNNQKTKKLNLLLGKVMPGMVMTQKWLNKLGISRYLAQRYCLSNWLERIGYGAYIRPGEQINWPAAVFALVDQLAYQIHIAGMTALILQGYEQHLNLGAQKNIWIFRHLHETRNLPSWFNHLLQEKYTVHCQKRNLLLEHDGIGIEALNVDGYKLPVSTPERAIFEFLDNVPQAHSVEQAQFIMETMVTLRPSLIVELLHACSSRKVKRLFLLLAKHEQHEWAVKINPNDFDLGAGKLQIGKGGYYYPTYQLTLPINLNHQEGYGINE